MYTFIYIVTELEFITRGAFFIIHFLEKSEIAGKTLFHSSKMPKLIFNLPRTRLTLSFNSLGIIIQLSLSALAMRYLASDRFIFLIIIPVYTELPDLQL